MDRAAEEQSVWDAYNLLLTCPDLERLRKLVVRYELFRRTIGLPGDVVEAGVYKGTGLLTFLKLLQIHAAGSAKRVIGFDLFDDFEAHVPEHERAQVRKLTWAARSTGSDVTAIAALAARAGFGPDRCVLRKGDIAETAAAMCRDEPGFRISLLHLDLDLGDATHAALEALWDRVVRGGVVILDEYGVPGWSASAGIDAFFATRGETIETLPYARTPGGFVVKR